MTTATLLLLLVGAASTMAFTPPESYRSRRDAADGAKSSSFSSSGSSSGSGAGFGPGFGRGGQYPYYPNPNHFQQYVPFDFQAAFQQYFENMQRLAAMQNSYANNLRRIAGRVRDEGRFTWAGSAATAPVGTSSYYNTVPLSAHQRTPYRHRPQSYSNSRAHMNFNDRFYGPGGNSLDSGYGGFSGSSSGSFSGPPQFGSFAGHGAFGSPPGNQGGGGPQVYGDDSDGSPVGAQASVNLDVRGGFAEASLVPDLGSRIGEELPAPNGGNFGVFTSSSSGSSDINGKKTSFKTATVGVNDNGKVTSYTV